jgi:hypothetical protein
MTTHLPVMPRLHMRGAKSPPPIRHDVVLVSARLHILPPANAGTVP